MVIILLLLTATISIADLQKEFPINPQEAGIVRDAIARWARKDHPAKSAMKNRIPIVFYLSRQRCVVLKLRVPSVGGSPAYCYDLRSEVLTESNEDVE